MLSRLSLWILNQLGWKVHAEFPDVKKYVVIAAPHTSNWDFPLGILAAKAVNLDIYWLGKQALFRWPWGWFFRALGGTPVYREQSLNLSQEMAELFARCEHLVLALAPEGTRKKTDHWKTGFYYIARAAHVPIVLGYLDHGHKQVGIGGVFYPGNDIEADFNHIRQFYKNMRGKIPENESLIEVRQPKNQPQG